MRTKQMLLDGRSAKIGMIVVDHEPITATGIRGNLIDKYGSNQYTDMTATRIAAHIRRHMGGVVERRRHGKDMYYTICRGGAP